MKRISLFLVVLAMLLVPIAAQAEGFTIGYSLKTITNDAFQLALYTGIKDAVEASGNTFVDAIAESQTAVATQVNQIEDLIAQGVDALILNPMDANAVIPVMEKAKAQNIPVILVDQGVNEHEDLYVTFVSTDNFAAAKLAGEKMAEILGGVGNVIIVRGANGSSAGDQRADGFKAGIEGTGLALVNEQAGDWVVDKAMQVTENMIQANPDIDGIFCCSDNMVPGILQALKNNDLNPAEICFISFDGAKAGCDYIAAGEMTGTMAQFPAIIGAKAVEVMLGVLDGSVDPAAIEKFVDAGTDMYTKDNLDMAAQYWF